MRAFHWEPRSHAHVHIVLLYVYIGKFLVIIQYHLSRAFSNLSLVSTICFLHMEKEHVEISIGKPHREETCFMPYANNKGAYQPAHPRSLLNTFVVRFWVSIMSLVSISETSRLYLYFAGEQVGLGLTWAQTPKDRFSRDEADGVLCSNIMDEDQILCYFSYSDCIMFAWGTRCCRWSLFVFNLLLSIAHAYNQLNHSRNHSGFCIHGLEKGMID